MGEVLALLAKRGYETTCPRAEECAGNQRMMNVLAWKKEWRLAEGWPPLPVAPTSLPMAPASLPMAPPSLPLGEELPTG